jgi:hypothetical protein
VARVSRRVAELGHVQTLLRSFEITKHSREQRVVGGRQKPPLAKAPRCLGDFRGQGAALEYLGHIAGFEGTKTFGIA